MRNLIAFTGLKLAGFMQQIRPLSWLTLAFMLPLFALPVQASKPFKVAILMFDEVQIIDFAAPYEVFGQAKFEVFTVSKNGKPVTTAMGLSVNPHYSFANMPEADAILVPGGDTGKVMHDQQVLSWLKTQQGKAEHILSVCTGAHILAEASLLDGKAATTFHRALNNFEKNYPAIAVKRQQRFVDNGQIVTSAGLSSGIDASLHLVSKVLGEDKARTVALHLEYDWDPDGGFVRANMADRMLPQNDYSWPDGILFDRISAFGDETRWQVKYKVTTSATAEHLLQVYKNAMAKHADWQLNDTGAVLQAEWRGAAENAGWLTSAAVINTAPDSYAITLNIYKRP
ncbi:DJ-1/PfpI family protein [Arsukibacterium sp. UBA3155]|uniref:DJ-1/PfpI family protein n=1 Tax=Arsukibacterium sp. UBA3155 TaxID=1946058 RepID=UPI0025C04EEC|nr:DJ-1/PfpI family protein [Arsukibacterium sp. UBA3155]|tara:strand:- start:10572 stop:11597 length:1026 start_codon:yes stop_codon:yes gene_type:complete